jgi:hypothetical protein
MVVLSPLARFHESLVKHSPFRTCPAAGRMLSLKKAGATVFRAESALRFVGDPSMLGDPWKLDKPRRA